MANNTSQHILNTSATLLGFCFFVITSMHSNNYSDISLIDEFASVIALFLISSCLFSYISIRSNSEIKEKKMESIADVLFLMALFGILLVVLFLAVDYMK